MKPLPGALAYGLGLTWCVLHLLFYLVWLRSAPSFCGEGRIFRYHFVSATLYSLLALIPFALAPSWPPFVVAAGLIALHGIYSISFLELWSLAQGSYSLSILAGIDAEQGGTSSDLIEHFCNVGDSKKSARIGDLFRLKLALKRGEKVQLTLLGRVAASACALLRWLPNLKETG